MPALRRPARHVVDDAVALEHLDGAVVHLDGNRHLDASSCTRRERRSGRDRRRTPRRRDGAARGRARRGSREGGSAPRWRSSAAARASHDERTLARHLTRKGTSTVEAVPPPTGMPIDAQHVATAAQARSAGPAARDAERVATRAARCAAGERAERAACRDAARARAASSGSSCGRSAEPSTRPATSDSTAGRTSDGSNESDESATCGTTGSRLTGTATLQGMRRRRPGPDDRADGPLERTGRREPRARPDRQADRPGCRPV